MGVYSTFCKAVAPVRSSLNTFGARMAGSRAAQIARKEAMGARAFFMTGVSRAGWRGGIGNLGNYAMSTQMRRDVTIGAGAGLLGGIVMAKAGMFDRKRRGY